MVKESFQLNWSGNVWVFNARSQGVISMQYHQGGSADSGGNGEGGVSPLGPMEKEN